MKSQIMTFVRIARCDTCGEHGPVVVLGDNEDVRVCEPCLQDIAGKLKRWVTADSVEQSEP